MRFTIGFKPLLHTSGEMPQHGRYGKIVLAREKEKNDFEFLFSFIFILFPECHPNQFEFA